MPHIAALNRLEAEVSSYFGAVSQGFMQVISLYAFGIAVTGRCGQSIVAEFIHALLDVKSNTIRQRLREMTYEEGQKRGSGRQALVVSDYFSPLMRWVLSKFAGDQHQVVLAFDATYLGTRFTVLTVSVVISSSAIPVAWHIENNYASGSWTPIWRRLLQQIHGAVPTDWQVSVLADAGLYSRDLFHFIGNDLKWHPHMRIDISQALCRAPGGVWFPMRQLVHKGMTPIVHRLYCFKKNPLLATVLLEWDLAYDKPCVVLTNLSTKQACLRTYHLRYWVEAGFKDFKRGGLQWHHTKMSCPARAERLWLVMSVALLYLASQDVPALQPPPTDGHYPTLSKLVRTWVHFIAKLIRGLPILTHSSFTYSTTQLPRFHLTYP